MKRVSIIVTCDEEQQIPLRRLLPELLSMVYGGEYEVIVVDKKHDKDLEEWLEEMEANHSHLSHTFCPATARGLDINKLAITLGAKAANYDWLAILPVDVKTENENWLKELTNWADDETEVVVGLTNRKRRWSWLKSYLFRRRFTLYRPTSSIILCRRSSLLQGKAFKLSNRQIIKL
ncbi:MAG: glycosyltransferase family 2 protein [Bacteroidaceae bacterium]|jgi:cellulose synthase/poly-beta-1,6-N-acetylglucosamine synthase-like glycosyltransferase|nr:glycosyltransferase family 2 protein [Bacteroidaceae bacterium]